MFLLLLGRRNPVVMLLIGVAGLAAGLPLHAYGLAASGAVLVVWGGVASLRRMRNRGSANDGGPARPAQSSPTT